MKEGLFYKIPSKILKERGIEQYSKLKIYIENEDIVLEKYSIMKREIISDRTYTNHSDKTEIQLIIRRLKDEIVCDDEVEDEFSTVSVDELGRIYIPNHIKEEANIINIRDLKASLEENKIILKNTNKN